MKTPEQIRELIAANRWRPIEEAPRDEPILIAYLLEGWDEVSITAWSERFECWQLELNYPDATIEYIGWREVPKTDELADVAEQLLEENERLRAERLLDEGLWAAAQHLLDLKAHKDRFGRDKDYEREKPKAWDALRKAVYGKKRLKAELEKAQS